MKWTGLFNLHSKNGISLILLMGEKRELERVLRENGDGKNLYYLHLTKRQVASVLSRRGLKVALLSSDWGKSSFHVERDFRALGVEVGTLYPLEKLYEKVKRNESIYHYLLYLEKWTPERKKWEPFIKILERAPPRNILERAIAYYYNDYYVFTTRIIVRVVERDESNLWRRDEKYISVKRVKDERKCFEELVKDEGSLRLLEEYMNTIVNALREMAHLGLLPQEECDAACRLFALARIATV